MRHVHDTLPAPSSLQVYFFLQTRMLSYYSLYFAFAILGILVHPCLFAVGPLKSPRHPPLQSGIVERTLALPTPQEFNAFPRLV